MPTPRQDCLVLQQGPPVQPLLAQAANAAQVAQVAYAAQAQAQAQA